MQHHTSETIIIILIYLNICNLSGVLEYFNINNYHYVFMYVIIYMQICIMISECYGQNTTTKQEVPFECIVI